MKPQVGKTPEPPDFDGCFAVRHDEEVARLYDTRRWPDANAARADYARDLGVASGEDGEPRGPALDAVTARPVYVRWYTDQEQWERLGKARWGDWHLDDLIDAGRVRLVGDTWVNEAGKPPKIPDAPNVPPLGWEPYEEDPVWTTCDALHPQAVMCWRVESVA